MFFLICESLVGGGHMLDEVGVGCEGVCMLIE